ncbi:hypothetical protein Pmani_040060 [Petrolisthes manimaculis]|uniref:Uncharacterized protein n=1 Tax=Petrolisthes manimaculis TaxID=1843537 RepID=A0AAE1NBM8_9EUCA|nr:hypothetical protein Pmani_040060 [Petrolisthes manimaculis]
MSRVPSVLTVTLFLLIVSTMADPSVQPNKVKGTSKTDSGSEKRACATCGATNTHGTSGYGTHGADLTYTGIDLGTGAAGLSGLAGLGGLGGLLGIKGGLISGAGTGLVSMSILAVNIAILVLVAIILAHVKSYGYYGDTGSGSGTGADYIHLGGAPSFAAGPSTYQGYDSGSSGYHKRSTEEARGLASPSVLSFFTRMVTDAIVKYADIDQHNNDDEE